MIQMNELLGYYYSAKYISLSMLSWKRYADLNRKIQTVYWFTFALLSYLSIRFSSIFPTGLETKKKVHGRFWNRRVKHKNSALNECKGDYKLHATKESRANAILHSERYVALLWMRNF